MVRVVEALGSGGAQNAAGGHVGVRLGVPTVLDSLPGHARLKLCQGRGQERMMWSSNEVTVEMKLLEVSHHGKMIRRMCLTIL